MADIFGGGTFGGGTFDDFDDTTEDEVIVPISSGIAPVETPIGTDEPEPEPELTSLAIRNEDIYLDGGGSFERVSGIDNVLQSVALDARDVLQFSIGDTITTGTIFELETQLKAAMMADPQVTDPISVAVSSIAPDNNEIGFSITTHDNEEFEVSMVLPDTELST